MLREGARAGVVGIPEAAIEGVGIGRTRAAGLSHEGKLPARLHGWPDRRCLSRRRLVSLLHAGSPRANHPGTSDSRRDRGGVRVRPESKLRRPNAAPGVGGREVMQRFYFVLA